MIEASRAGSQAEIRQRLKAIFPDAFGASVAALARYGQAEAAAAATARRAGGFVVIRPPAGVHTPGLSSRVEYTIGVNVQLASGGSRRELVIVSADAPLQKVALYEQVRSLTEGQTITVSFATGAAGAGPAIASVSDFSIIEVVGR